MSIATYDDFQRRTAGGKNTFSFANTFDRLAAFPLEKYSIFPDYETAREYASGEGEYEGLPFEGQPIAITTEDGQALYVLDSTATDNLRKVGDEYLSRYTGGTISGDVGVLGTFTGGDENSIAVGKSTFAFGDAISAIGDNSYAIGKNSVAGCYGWYYDHIDFENNAFYLTLTQPTTIYTSSLTGEGTVDTSFDSGLAVGDVISYVNKAKFDMELSVAAVDGNKITVQPFKNTSKYKLDESAPNHDDWSIFCLNKPIAGKIWFGEVANAQGLCCIAVNAYSHAEGRQNLAYGQYSHIEGYKNRGAYAAHAEGKGNYADGQYSHAEGWNTRTQKDCTHAEGNETSAYNECAHAEGHKTLASGMYSHAEGNQTSAVGTDSHAFGNKTYASGYCSFAGGDSVSATNSEAFAIGWKTTASGQYSFAGGQNTKSTANQSFVFGNSSEANGGSSFASGWKCVADKDNTYAFGLSAIADHKESFVWNAKSNERYVSNGQGTFNINPTNNLRGFYIGADDFISCIVKAVQAIATDSTKKAALKTALQTILA